MVRQYIKLLAALFAVSIPLLLISGALHETGGQVPVMGEARPIALPSPDTKGTVPLETALMKRRSIRLFQDTKLSLKTLAQLLWSAQGVTDKRGYRTAPSAGALYPLNIDVVTGQVEALDAGIYRYGPAGHSLTLRAAGDFRKTLCRAALRQDVICHAPAVLIISSMNAKTTVKYGARGARYIYMEAGHAAQNIALQATALELGSVTIGAFTDTTVAKTLKLGAQENPLYIIPIGKPRNLPKEALP